MMKLISPGKPTAYYAELGPASSEEAAELEARDGDPSASDSVYTRRNPTPCDGEVDAILQDETGKLVRYDFGDGKCYSMDGEELPDEYAERVRRSGCVPHGNASNDESLKLLIAHIEPFMDEDDVVLVEGGDNAGN